MSDRIEELFDGLASDTLDHTQQDELASLLEDRQDWNGLTRLYEALADKAESDEGRVELYRKAADVAEVGGEDLEKVVELLGNTLMGSDEEIVSTLSRMRTLLHSLEDWGNWVEVADSEVTMLSDVQAVTDLFLEMGDIAANQLNDLPRALDYFQQAYGQDNTCLRALAKARAVFEIQEEWDSMFELFQLELEAVDAAERSAELLCEMGEVATRIGADEDAETCFREALNYVEAYPRALVGLGLPTQADTLQEPEVDASEGDTTAQQQVDGEVLPSALDDDTDTQAYEVAADAEGATDDDEAISDTEAEASLTTQEPALPETEQYAQVEDEAEMPSDTSAHETQADASDTMVAESVEEAVGQTDEETEEEALERMERFEALMDEASMSEPEAQVELLCAAAKLGRGEDAARAYLLAVQAEPANLNVYLQSGRSLAVNVDEAMALRDSILATAEAYPENETTLKAHALLLAGNHFDEARAVDQGLRELTRKMDADAVKVWQIQWFIETGKWRNAQQLVTESFEGDANTVRLQGLKAIGRLAETRGNDVEKAVGFWRQAFQTAPDDAEVREALMRLYPIVGKWKEYGAVLKIELETVPSDDAERRLELIRALIPIASDHLRQDQLVVTLYQELLELDPTDAEAREALASRFEKMRNWPQLVGFYEGQAASLAGDELLDLRLKVAEIYLSKMRNQVEAIQAYERVLEDYPGNPAALVALEQLYEKRRSWDQYVEVRLQVAESCEDLEGRLEGLRALAVYSEKKIRRPQLTLQLWQRVLDAEPSDSAALTAMVSLYEQTKDWHGLLEIVGQMQSADVEPKVLASSLAKAGTVASERLEDPEASLPFWNALATLEPGNRRVVENYKKVLIGLGMWDELEDFLGANEQWSDLVRVFETQSAQQTNLELQVELLNRAANIYESELEQPDKSARTLERIIVLDAAHVNSLRKLGAYYESKDDLRKLANILPSLIELESDEDSRLQLQFQNAHICLKSLRNPNLALEALEPIFKVRPFFDGSLDLILEIGQQSRQWEPVAQILALGADDSSAAETTDSYVNLVLELALIHADKLRDESESIRRYQQVLEHDAHNETALNALETLFEKTDRWFDLLQIVEIRTELIEDAEQRCLQIERQAGLYEHQLDDLTSAIDCYLRMIEETGRDAQRVDALRRLYLQTEQFAQLYGLLCDYVEEIDGPQEQEPIQLELARLASTKLSDSLGAIEHYKAVIDVRFDEPKARFGLEELLSDDDVRGTAASALRPIYEQLEAWSELVLVLEILVKESDDDDETKRLLEELGDVLTSRLEQPARALPVFGTLLQSEPDEVSYLNRCLELAAEANVWAECTQILELIVGELDVPATRIVMLRRLGEVYENEQNATAMAIDAYRRICEDEPNDRESLVALGRLFFAAEQWSDLLEVYRIELDIAQEDEDKQTKRFQMAQLLEEFLSQPQGAIELYLEVLVDDGENEQALKSLARLFAFEEMWAELADILESQIGISQDADATREYRLDLAEVRELRLSEIDSALEIYEEVIAGYSDNERVRHALERLLNDENVRGKAAELLEPIYLEREDPRGLVTVLGILQELTDDVDARVSYLVRIVSAQDEALNQPGDAFHTLVLALSVDPSREDLLLQLLALAKRLEAWSELAGHLESIAETSQEPAVSSSLFVQLGLVQRDELGDLEQARHFLELALVRDESNLAAFSHLDTLFSNLAESEALTSLLLKRAEVENEPQQSTQHRLRAARVFEEELHDPSNAIEVYQQVLSEQEDCSPAIDALERLYRITERWQDYLALLETKIEALDDDADSLPLWFQMAETYERELNDLPGAVSAYESILEQSPDSLDALRRVDRLYEMLEQWDEQLTVLERQIELIDEPSVKTNLAFRAAHLKDTRLMELEEALIGYGAVLEQDAHHEQCLSRLEDWVRENREISAAMEVLVPRLEANESWTRLISNYEAVLDHLDILDERIETNQRIASIFEHQLEDPRQAFQVLGRALTDDMTRADILDELERLSGTLSSWGSYIQLLEESLERIPNAFAAKDLNARLARLCEAHVEDSNTAIGYHQKVLEVEPDNETTLGALDRLYGLTENWSALAYILEQRAQFADDGPREEFLYRLGACYVDRLSEFDKGVACFDQVLEQEQIHSRSIAALEGMFERNQKRQAVGALLESAYREIGDYRKLHDMSAVLVSETDDANTKLNLLLSLAEIAETHLEEPQSAYRWYSEAFVLQPLDEELREQAEAYAGRLDRYIDWVERLTEAMAACEDAIRIQDLAVERGLVEFHRLRRIEQAEVAMRHVIDELDPVNPDALAVLDDIYRQTGQTDHLIDVLRLRADVLVEDDERITLKLRLAELLVSTSQDDEAVRTYEEVVELDVTTTDALNALVDLYVAREAWNELLEVYQKQTQVTEPGANQAMVFAKMARLASDALQRPEDAIEYWGEVLRIRGENREALGALELLYTATESWRDLVDVLERQVSLVEGNTQRELEIYEKLGQIWGDELDREEKSIDNWKKVLELAPDQLTAKWALIELYERSDRFEDFVTMGTELIDTLEVGGIKEQELARKLARVATDELKSNARATQYWARVLATLEADDEALSNLEELYTEAEDWRNCALILQKRAELCVEEFEQVSAWFRVAEVAHERLEDSEMLHAALGKVLEVDPKNLDAMQQLEESYDACEMWEEKVGLLLQRLESTSDTYEQGDLFESIAGLFEEKLGSVDNAFEVYLQAFEATQDEERFGGNLARLAQLPEQWQQLVSLYEKALGGASTRMDQVDMRLRTAQWSLNELSDSDRAAGHFRAVLAVDPSSLAALIALGDILEVKQSWSELPPILEARINLEDDEGLMQTLALKLAEIYDGRLGLEAEAVVWYRRALDFDQENLDILAALEGALTVQMNWTELVDVFERQIEYSVDEASKFDKQLALAELFENQLGDANRAVGVYQELLENGSKSLEVMGALKRLLTTQARWYEVLDLFPTFVEATSEIDMLTDLYTEWAEVQMTHLSDTDGAVETLRKLFELIPENVDTVAVLDDLYRSFERYDELAELYVLHLSALTQSSEIEFAMVALATLYIEILEEPSRAREVLDTNLDKVSSTGDAMLMLLSLCESQGDDLRRAELLTIHIDSLDDPEAVLSRKAELAELYLTALDQDEKSEALYRAILAQDPYHIGALRALTLFAKRESNWAEAIELTQLAEVHAKTLEDKSAALYEIGSIHADHLNDMASGLEYFEQAADVWPDNYKASDLLIGYYWGHENWIRLDPLLRSWLVRNEDNKGEEPQYFDRCKQMAHCAEMLGDDAAALVYIRTALDLDRTDLDALEQCGRLLVKGGELADASTTYLTILAHHRDSLTPAKSATIYQHLGRIKGQQGEMRKALDFFRKALDVDAESVDTQRALIELHTERGDWNDVVHYQRSLLDVLTEKGDRFELLIGLAETHFAHLDQARMAIECLEQARELSPDSRIVLGKLMELHEKTEDWGALVQVLQHLAELETEGSRKAKLWCAIAVHQQQHLDDRFTAVRSFDKALDFDPSFLEAFEAIANILNQDRDYARQDRYYRKMLKRALENKLDDNLVFTLGKGLGEINRTRLKNYSEAIKAYKIALVRKPDDIDTHQIIAQLYELEDDSESAIAQYAKLLRHDPRSVETYRNMKKLYLEIGRFDEAWCVCQALCFLQVANDEEKEFFAKRRARSLKGTAQLSQQQWALVSHPRKSSHLDQLLSILYPILMPAMARNLKDFGLHRRKSVVDPRSELPVNVVFSHVQKLTGLARPTVYQGMDNARGVLNINSNPPGIAIGQDVLQPSSVQSLCFDVARGAYLAAQPYLLASFPEDVDYKSRQVRVKKTLYSLMKVINPSSQAQHDPGLVELFSSQLQSDGLRVVTKLLGEMSQDSATHLDATRWLDGVDLTADRLGLLCSNDLAHAVNAMKNGPANLGKVEVTDKIKELIIFSVSPEYMKLRSLLGIAQ
jgi:golgin subfamily B member 1